MVSEGYLLLRQLREAAHKVMSDLPDVEKRTTPCEAGTQRQASAGSVVVVRARPAGPVREPALPDLPPRWRCSQPAALSSTRRRGRRLPAALPDTVGL